IGIGQFSGPGGRPGFAAVFRFRLEDETQVVRTAQSNQHMVARLEKSWLNDAAWSFRHLNGAKPSPTLAVVRGALQPTGPGLVTLYRAACQDGSVGALDRLVFDRAEQTGGKLLGLVPGLAAVSGAPDEGGPAHGVGTGLVKEEESLA